MNHSAPRLLLAAGAIMAFGLTGCTSGSSESTAAGATAAGDSGCADVVATAQKAVDMASTSDTPWDGPTTGPKAVAGKTLVYVAQSMTNPGGVSAGGAPFNVGAGDGDSSALQRITAGEYQTGTVPSPLKSEGWQIVDELNRAFNKQPASGYVPQVHVSTKENTTATDAWDPVGYQAAYRAIWGK